MGDELRLRTVRYPFADKVFHVVPSSRITDKVFDLEFFVIYS